MSLVEALMMTMPFLGMRGVVRHIQAKPLHPYAAIRWKIHFAQVYMDIDTPQGRERR
jgi:hypothetical protein